MTDNDKDVDNATTHQSESLLERGGEEDGSANDNCYGGFARIDLYVLMQLNLLPQTREPAIARANPVPGA